MYFQIDGVEFAFFAPILLARNISFIDEAVDGVAYLVFSIGGISHKSFMVRCHSSGSDKRVMSIPRSAMERFWPLMIFWETIVKFP